MTPTVDRLPPHTPEAELSSIGAFLCQPDTVEHYDADMFYDARHRALFAAIQKQSANGGVDAVTLAGLVHGMEGGDRNTSQTLVDAAQDACPSPANWPVWAEQLRSDAILRSVLRKAQEAVMAAMSPGADAGTVLDAFERDALSIRQGHGGKFEPADIRRELHALVGVYEAAATNQTPVGVKTGFPDLDKLIGGLRPGQLFIIAARPSVGKTALGLAITERVAIQNQIPVAFVSLEMTTAELLHRLTCSIASVDGQHLMGGTASDREIKSVTVASGRLSQAPLYIVDRPGITTSQLAGLARRQMKEHGIKLLIVDYLGLLRSGDRSRSRYENITDISNDLKRLALELRLPVIAMSQLNRDNDREGRVPRMSDLRDSGSLEQDADIVGLLHRDEAQTGDAQSIALFIPKNRQGRIGKIDLVFHRNFTRFDSVGI